MFNLPYESRADHIEGVHCYSKLRYLNRIKVHHLLYYPTAEIVKHGLADNRLTSGSAERLIEECEGDFYDQQDSNEENKVLVSAYAALYKIFPLMPDSWLRWLVKGDRVKMLRRMPSPVLAFLQLLIAIKNRDLRFRAYLSEYPRKIAVSWRRRAR